MREWERKRVGERTEDEQAGVGERQRGRGRMLSCRWRDERGIERWRRKGEGEEKRKQRARKAKERDREITAGTEIRRRKGEEEREKKAGRGQCVRWVWEEGEREVYLAGRSSAVRGGGR